MSCSAFKYYVDINEILESKKFQNTLQEHLLHRLPVGTVISRKYHLDSLRIALLSSHVKKRVQWCQIFETEEFMGSHWYPYNTIFNALLNHAQITKRKWSMHAIMTPIMRSFSSPLDLSHRTKKKLPLIVANYSTCIRLRTYTFAQQPAFSFNNHGGR